MRSSNRFDQEKLTKSLRDNSEQFFENLDRLVFMFDAHGKFVFFNKASEKFLGYDKKEVMGNHFRLLLTLDDLSDGFLFLYQTLHGCYTEHSLFRIRRKDGSTRVVEITAGPLYYENRVIAALAIAHDVTGRSPQTPQDSERIQIFKKFSEDFERWAKVHQKSPNNRPQ